MTHIEAKEYYEIIYDILSNDEFQKRKKYHHHGDITVYDHSLAVSKLSYIIAKKLKKDYKSAAIGGLLHDFYREPWQEKKEKEKFLKKHGFTHAKDAKENSYYYFPQLMNNKIENIILRHMFPLNKIPPKYVEGWIVTFADKYISLEVFKNPKFLYRLIGIQKKVGD